MTSPLRAIAIVITLTAATTASADASCGDRPGTPDEVKAEARDGRDGEGRRTREIVFKWRNTARTGEQVFWDIDVTDGSGTNIPQRAGSGRAATVYHETRFNAYLVGPNETRCFRIKARTTPGTEGCVSAQWSARVCATSPGRALVRRR